MQIPHKGSFSKPEPDPKRTAPTGSFGRPAEAPATPTSTPIVEPEPATEESIENTKREKQEEDLIRELQEDLGIVVDEDDIWGLILGNTLEKRQIKVIPNKLYATFRSLSMKDSRYIEEHLADAVQSKKLLEEGFKKLNIQYMLAGGVLEVGRPGKVASLGESIQERFTAVDGMSAIVVDKLSKKWGSFTLLLELIIKRDVERGK